MDFKSIYNKIENLKSFLKDTSKKTFTLQSIAKFEKILDSIHQLKCDIMLIEFKNLLNTKKDLRLQIINLLNAKKEELSLFVDSDIFSKIEKTINTIKNTL